MFNKKIDFIQKEKRCIFKINNFLDQEFYNQLENNFPDIDTKKIDLNKSFGKKFIDNEDPNLDLQNQSTILQKFDDLIKSKTFFDFFSKKLYFYAAFTQNNILRRIKYLRYPISNKGSDNKIMDILFSKLKVGYDYSFIKNKGGIVPHVDAQRKYLSLMLYFPKKNKADKNYGTTFWDCDEKNYSNEHLEDLEKNLSFKKKYKELYKTTFKPNCLYGFIRNDISWHSVEPRDISDDYLRRSININFYYIN